MACEERDLTWVVKSENGKLEATIAAFGATIVSLYVADVHGKKEDVLLGHSRDVPAIRAAVEDTARGHPFFNCSVGRVCGRIGAGGRFEIDGKPVQVTANEGNGAKMLHGGLRGFNTKVWHRNSDLSKDSRLLRLETTSEDGEEGFPGRLFVAATFEAVSDGEDKAGLKITYEAHLDKAGTVSATVANLTNHFYVNLAPGATLGHGGITNHTLWIAAEHYLPLDSIQLPTGVVAPVDDVMSFMKPHKVGDRIKDVDGKVGYDHYYVADAATEKCGDMRKVAELHSDESGRTMCVFTTQPGLVLYTANWIEGIQGKDGVKYSNWDALCMETQGYPDAVHWPAFPSITLHKDELLHHDTLLLFSSK